MRCKSLSFILGILLCCALILISAPQKVEASPLAGSTRIVVPVYRSTYLDEGEPDSSPLMPDFLYVGSYIYGIGTAHRQSLMQCTLPEIGDNSIEAAYLHIWQSPANDGKSVSVMPRRVEDSWVMGEASWNNQPATYNTGDKGGQLNDAGGWQDIDITNMMRTWYSGAPNNGFLLEAAESGEAVMREFVWRAEDFHHQPLVYLYLAPDSGENPCVESRELVEFYPRAASRDTRFRAVGYSFPANTNVLWTLTRLQDGLEMSGASLVTDDRGIFDRTFIVAPYATPNQVTEFSLSFGTYGSDCTHHVVFSTIPDPQITVTPESGLRPYWDEDYIFKLYGQHLTPNEMAQVSVIKPDGSRFDFGEVYVNAEGHFRNEPVELIHSGGINASEFFQGGEYIIQALDGGDRLSTTSVRIVRPFMRISGQGDYSYQSSVGWIIGVGDILEVHGRNYPPNTELDVFVKNLDSGTTRVLGWASVTVSGSWTLETEVDYLGPDPRWNFEEGRNRIYTDLSTRDQWDDFSLNVNTPVAWPDVQITDIEVTQGIQSLSGLGVHMVAGKPTWVRVYASSTPRNTPNVRCVLQAERDGEALQTLTSWGERGDRLYPLPDWDAESDFDRYVPAKELTSLGGKREDPDSTFVFALPHNWVNEVDYVTFTAKLLPPIPQADSENDSRSKMIYFNRSYSMSVTRLRVQQTMESPPNNHPDDYNIIEYVQHMYPVDLNDLHIWITDGYVGYMGGEFDFTNKTDWSLAVARIAWYDFWTDDSEDFMHYYGMVNDDYNGKTGGIGGMARVGGYAGLGIWDREINDNKPRWHSPTGGRTMAHELGHNLNFNHVNSDACGADPENINNNYPYTDGQISEGNYCDVWGFSPYAFRGGEVEIMYPKSTYDIMSYCSPKWISDYHYHTIAQRLYGRHEGNRSALNLESPNRSNRAQEYLIVSGLVDLEGEESQLLPIYQVPELPADYILKYGDMEVEPSGVTLVQRDESDNLLRTDPVPMDVFEGDYAGKQAGPSPFFLTLPLESGVQVVEMESGGEVLARRKASPNAPTLTLVGPKESMVAPTTLTFTLDLDDPDGDTLYTLFQFRPDGSSGWSLVPHVEKPGGDFEIPNAALPGAEYGVFRAVITDGFRTIIEKFPYTFTVRNKAPMPTILQPQEDYHFTESHSITLAGQAQDQEEGMLTGESLEWRLDGRPLAQGNPAFYSNPGAGTHTLTLTAWDSDGADGSTSVTFYVSPVAPIYSVDPPRPEYVSPAYGGSDIAVDAPLSWQIPQAGTILTEYTYLPPFEGTVGGMDLYGDDILIARAYNPSRVYAYDPESYETHLAFDSPYQLNGICHDGSHFWGVKVAPAPKVFFRFNTEGDILAEYAMPDFYTPTGITWDGENIWLLGWGDPGRESAIFKVNPFDGAILETFNLGLDRVGGLCFDGKNLWLNDKDNAQTCQVSREDGAILGQFNTPPSAGLNNGKALAYKDGTLWILSGDDGNIYPTSPGDLTLGERVYYSVYLDENHPPRTLVGAAMEETSMVTHRLKSMQYYFWRVIAWTPEGGESLGPVWSFTTGMPPLSVEESTWTSHE